MNTENLYLSQPDCGEQALSFVDSQIRRGSVDVVVVNNVSMMQTVLKRTVGNLLFLYVEFSFFIFGYRKQKQFH